MCFGFGGSIIIRKKLLNNAKHPKWIRISLLIMHLTKLFYFDLYFLCNYLEILVILMYFSLEIQKSLLYFLYILLITLSSIFLHIDQ